MDLGLVVERKPSRFGTVHLIRDLRERKINMKAGI